MTQLSKDSDAKREQVGLNVAPASKYSPDKNSACTFSVIGSTVIDQYLMGLSKWPMRPSEREQPERLEYSPGGSGFNVAIGIAALVKANVSLLTAYGHKGNGQLLNRMFRGESNREPRLQGTIFPKNANPRESDLHTGVSIVCLDGQKNPLFIACPGANVKIDNAFLRRHIETITGSRFLHIGGLGILTGIDLFELASFLQDVRARNKEITITLDVVLLSKKTAAINAHDRLILSVLQHVDYFLPSEEEAWQFAGIESDGVTEDPKITNKRAARVFNLKTRKATIIKRSAAGVSVYPRVGNPYNIEPDEVVDDEKIIDTLGAGDTWNAGFLGALFLNENLDHACAIANRVAAGCIQKLGGATGVRPISEYLNRPGKLVRAPIPLD